MGNLKTCCISSLIQVLFSLYVASYTPTPTQNIAINCGSTNNEYTLITNTPTVTATAPHHLSTHVPYTTARLSRSPFTYSFHLPRGPKLLRLHFYPASYPGGFNRHNALFTVRAAHRTLLNHFNASHHADNFFQPTFSIEYRINVEPPAHHNNNNNNLNITFTPSSTTHPHAYAFINGIEVLSYTNTVKRSNRYPTQPPPPPPTTPTKASKKITVVASIAAASFILVSVIAFFIFLCVKRASSSSSSSSSSARYSTNTSEASNPCRLFSISEIRSATNNFDDALIIGNGGFGNVYKGRIGTCHGPVAIKRLSAGSEQGAREFQTEINMLSQLRHPHLVSLIGYCNDGGEMILVYDFMARGTLRDHLYGSQHNPLLWKKRLEICLDAARGLHFLHDGVNRPSVIHRDVKSTNILLDHDWVAKVSDFGLSKVNGPNGSHVTTDVKGSLGYLDPEYYMSLWLTQKSDVYSFGVVLMEVLCGRAPIKRRVEKQEESLVAWVKKCFDEGNVHRTVDPALRGEIRPKCLNKFVEVALSCLNDHGKERPLMKDVVKGLESAMRLQHSGSRGGPLFRGKEKCNNSEDLTIGDKSNANKATTTSSEEEQALVHGIVFSQLGNPTAR